MLRDSFSSIGSRTAWAVSSNGKDSGAGCGWVFAACRGGGRAQFPSLPVDDPLTSDKKGVCLPYTRVANILDFEQIYYFCLYLFYQPKKGGGG